MSSAHRETFGDLMPGDVLQDTRQEWNNHPLFVIAVIQRYDTSKTEVLFMNYVDHFITYNSYSRLSDYSWLLVRS